MIKCLICNKEIKNSLGMASHLRHNHSEYTVQSYYDTFLRQEDEGKCIICGNPTTFDTIEKGYRKHCCSKCSQNDTNVRIHVTGRKSQFSNDILNSDYNKKGYHVYRYDFIYNNKTYHYVGHTIHSQIERISNQYPKILKEAINFYGKEQFLINYCTIIQWFDTKISATDFEEKLNIQVKTDFGEETVLSIANGRKPTKQCINGAIKVQKEHGSWNKGKKLSIEHRKAISNSGKKSQKLRYLKEMLECIDLYINDQFNNTYRIQRYIRQHYDKSFKLSKETILPYIEIINCEVAKND